MEMHGSKKIVFNLIIKEIVIKSLYQLTNVAVYREKMPSNDFYFI
jgi:hypothetical protein